MRYDRYSYIRPLRAEKAVTSAFLSHYATRGWLAQVKLNGTNSVVFVPPKGQGEVFARTRHDTEHKAWAFTPDSIAAFERVRTNNWSVFNAELMHSKGNGIKDTHYLHDVLVLDGVYLLGRTYQERYELLTRAFKPVREGSTSHHVVDSHTWLAKNHTADFRNLFNSLVEGKDEGLVLKNPQAHLTVTPDKSWTVKCRKFSSNYGF
jgi:hypothetical protein